MKTNALRSTILLIAACAIAILLPYLSMVFQLPEFIALFSIAFILIVLLLFAGSWSRFRKIWTITMSVIVIVWSIWTVWFRPYWNSQRLSQLAAMPYDYSKAPEDKVSSKEAEKDLMYAFKYVKKIHPALRKSIPERFLSSYNQAKTIIEANDSLSVNELYVLLETMVATLHDGHTVIVPEYKDWHYIKCNNFYDLLAVNGTPIDSIYSEKKHLYSSETDDFARFRLKNEIMIYEYLPFLGIDIDDSITYSIETTAGNIIDTICRKADFFSNYSEKSNRITQTGMGYHCMFDSIDIAYLNIGNFICYLPGKRKEFRTGIKEFFADIEEKGIGNLIIDLRSNTGGNPKRWHEIMNYLTDENVCYGSREVRRGPFVFKFKNKCRTHNAGYIFPGQVYVLTSNLTFSAAMEFTDCLQGNNMATIIGSAPGNTPECYTNITIYQLPHSRLQLRISSELHHGTERSAKTNRIIPDVECPSELAYQKAKELILSK